MSSRTFVIVGGGISGLTAAIALQQKGEEVHVFERFPSFRPAGAGLIVAPNALNALDRLGLAGKVIEEGQTSRRGMAILNDKGTILSELEALDYEYPMISIHRADLQRILLDALKPGTVTLGKTCADITYGADQVTVTFEDQTTVVGNYLLAADGIHSVIRAKLFGAKKLRYAGYTCWRGVADCWPNNQQRFTETWGSRGRFGVIPLSKEKTYWYALFNGPAQDTSFARYNVHDLLKIFGAYHSSIAQILSSTPDDKVIHSDIYDIAPLQQFTDGRTLLMGDAAHAITPNLGQGACQAIEDAVELVICLKQHRTVESAFFHFEKKRIKRTTMISKRSLSLGKLAQLENPFLCMVRNGMIRLIPPSLQKKQLEYLYKVNFTD
jgi:2-polyprenyl-6-methoxyphenol hydroxylase-like FAD-dependent oxidoreductase